MEHTPDVAWGPLRQSSGRSGGGGAQEGAELRRGGSSEGIRDPVFVLMTGPSWTVKGGQAFDVWRRSVPVTYCCVTNHPQLRS